MTSKLLEREKTSSLRSLPKRYDLTDFASNDYLGFARNREIFDRTSDLLLEKAQFQNGATGSRLLSGNSLLYSELEEVMADFHNVPSALIFNSGYDANIGFFASVPQRGDLIFYDEWIHASIRDGIRMSNAKSYKFKHNDLEDLRAHMDRIVNKDGNSEIYVVTESVFSMDGDTPDLRSITDFCEENSCYLIVDEAHAAGVFGVQGQGLLQELGLHQKVFARIVTFGKALGCHGAAVLGSKTLKSYLINFARSFIYTTGMPPHSLATVLTAHHFSITPSGVDQRQKLKENIHFFNQELKRLHITRHFIESNSAIHCCIISGNDAVKKVARNLQEAIFDVRPILSPTIPQGQERLRFCLHSFNTKQEITQVLELLAKFI
ncbi:MAG: 8-amino-7-oxononanoate synthase [Saonia sp.]